MKCDGALSSPRERMFAKRTSFSKFGFQLSPETLAKEEEKKKGYPWAQKKVDSRTKFGACEFFPCMNLTFSIRVFETVILVTLLRAFQQWLWCLQTINSGSVWSGGRRNWACTKHLKAGAEKNNYL